MTALEPELVTGPVIVGPDHHQDLAEQVALGFLARFRGTTRQNLGAECDIQKMTTTAFCAVDGKNPLRHKGFMTPAHKYRNDPSDLWDHVDMSGGVDACWPWKGGRSNGGYGQWTIRQRTVRAHRVAWEYVHGPIPAGMVICHRCDNPPCCNPAHLFLGTTADNNLDMRLKGRAKEHTHGAKHGTYSGYVRHVRQRHGEWAMPACDECRAANAAYQRRRNAG